MKDVINRREILVGYCTTEEMGTVVLTKPLQGKSYQIMRIKLVNMPGLSMDTGENGTAKGINT